MTSPNPLFDLTGKVAIVTGALGLIGKEHGRALARAGAHVVATDLPATQAKLDEYAASLTEETGVKAIGVGAEITEPASVQALLDATLAAFGHVDVLVNNAAMDDKVDVTQDPEKKKFENFPVEQFRRILDVNVTGSVITCQIIGGEMAARGKGSIINVASTYGVVAPNQNIYKRPDGSQSFYKNAAYPTSKAALIMLTKYLAAYWGTKGVRVNTLCPGGVGTEGTAPFFRENYTSRTPLGRMAQPTDYQGALVYLASDSSAYMTGTELIVDGGWTCW